MSQAETEKYAIGMYERVNKLWMDRGPEILNATCGFGILNGPPIFRPKLMIIGANGGFGRKDSDAHIDKELPEFSSTFTADWPLAKRIINLFEMWDLTSALEEALQTNFLFFKSESVRRWYDVNKTLREELKIFCLNELRGYAAVSQPRAILVLGIGSFTQHATEIEGDSTLYDRSQKRRLLMKGRVFDVPAFGVQHPTGSRVANDDWRRVGPHIRGAVTTEHP